MNMRRDPFIYLDIPEFFFYDMLFEIKVYSIYDRLNICIFA